MPGGNLRYLLGPHVEYYCIILFIWVFFRVHTRILPKNPSVVANLVSVQLEH